MSDTYMTTLKHVATSVADTISEAIGSDKPSTQAFCPRCEGDLINDCGDVLANNVSTGRVVFQCLNCGIKSTWDFGTPSPILLKTGE